ncbi:DUF2911 domain-containing protein [Oleiharenicola lentus]|uniref:DUF2911 domain-containing protein n=1 Tax=Oleiharenicola lentus TaxID=2508720 RepID=UPI003F677804
MHSSRLTSVLAALAMLAVSGLRAQTTAATPPTPAPATPPAKIANSTGGTTPHETTSAIIGERKTGGRVTVTYGRPYSKHPRTGVQRKVWGELVKWNEANRLGADEATLLLTQKPLVIAGTTLPAGAYTLYIIPSETGATKLAFSSALGKWGVPVDETKDVARFDLTKSSLETSVDQLTIIVENDKSTPNTGKLKIQWETTQFTLPFTVQI